MDWFERLTGFKEDGYETTRSKLVVDGTKLRSVVNDAAYEIGYFELAPLQTLRGRAGNAIGSSGRIKVNIIQGDVRQMHQSPEYAGALFQVASQFNMLEMLHFDVTPENGVTRYQCDHTQGPACAIAAGAATIYRNYFVPVEDIAGQTATRQLDGLADIGTALSSALARPVEKLWRMQNGYALATREGLAAIGHHLEMLAPEEIDELRGRLRIGVHRDVEVTDAAGPKRPLVSQAFCSALPVAYGLHHADHWAPFARLVLEAAYEATLWSTVLNARRGGSNIVLLTLLGGGAFGNRTSWIHEAIGRALDLATAFDIDVKLVSRNSPSPELRALARQFA